MKKTTKKIGRMIETIDIFFTCFLIKNKKFNVVNLKKTNGYKKWFVIDVQDSEENELRLEYMNSDVIEIKNIIDTLKG